MNIINDLNIFDFLVIAIIIMSAISGFNKGFINSAGKLVAAALGVVAAIMLYDNLVKYLQEYYGLVDSLSDLIRSKIPLAVSTLDTNISGMSFEDTAHYLAYLIIVAVSFIIIYLLTNQVVVMLCSGFDHLFSHGFLSLINRLSGLLLAMIKSILIISIVLGLIYPALIVAANIGFYVTLPIINCVNESLTATFMLEWYNLLKDKLFTII